jgi:hypothetical protein
LEVFTSLRLEIRPVWGGPYSHGGSFLAARKSSAERRRKSRNAVWDEFLTSAERPDVDDIKQCSRLADEVNL